jgi:hypothetical protein
MMGMMEVTMQEQIGATYGVLTQPGSVMQTKYVKIIASGTCKLINRNDTLLKHI